MNDWGNLPADLLRKIEERLILYVHKVRFKFVCKSWQSALPQVPNLTEIRHPWLLFPSMLDGASHGLLDVVTMTTKYYLNLHDKSLYFKGSSHGWLVAMNDDCNVINLVHPLTRLHTQLPPRSKFPDSGDPGIKYYAGRYDHLIDGSVTNAFSPVMVGDIFTKKIVLSSNPSFSDDYLAVAIYGRSSRLAYTKRGAAKWTHINSNKYYSDIIFYQGKLFALTFDSLLMVIEFSSRNPRVTQLTTTPRPGNQYFYLVESSVGLLLVERITEIVRGEYRGRQILLRDERKGFHVYKLEFSEGKWSRITNIGDHILFIGHNCSMWMSSEDCPAGYKGNNIYFAKRFLSCRNCTEETYFEIVVFDLKTEKFEELRAPCLDWNRQVPIWFTPVAY